MKHKIATAAVVLAAVAPAGAASRHRHSVPIRDARVSARAAPPDSFYPEDIAGGVHGNLPFNNQLRKLSDPLNANGAGR